MPQPIHWPLTYRVTWPRPAQPSLPAAAAAGDGGINQPNHSALPPWLDRASIFHIDLHGLHAPIDFSTPISFDWCSFIWPDKKKTRNRLHARTGGQVENIMYPAALTYSEWFSAVSIGALNSLWHCRNVSRIWVRGSMPTCRLRRRKFRKFDYTKWCILKYLWINMWSAQRRSLHLPALIALKI